MGQSQCRVASYAEVWLLRGVERAGGCSDAKMDKGYQGELGSSAINGRQRPPCACRSHCIRQSNPPPPYAARPQVLNLLLYALLRRSPDARLLEFLAADEQLVDIGDDLVDYEEDVLRNTFNIYRGAARAPRRACSCAACRVPLIAACGTDERMKRVDAYAEQIPWLPGSQPEVSTNPESLPGGRFDETGHAGYVHLFGAEAELKLVQQISRLEAEHRRLLCALPAAVQACFHARHRQASAVPGALRLTCSQCVFSRLVHEDARLVPSTAFP